MYLIVFSQPYFESRSTVLLDSMDTVRYFSSKGRLLTYSSCDSIAQLDHLTSFVYPPSFKAMNLFAITS